MRGAIRRSGRNTGRPIAICWSSAARRRPRIMRRSRFGGANSAGADAVVRAVDMLVAPVVPVAPLTLAEMEAFDGAPPLASAAILRFTIPFNLAGVPSLTMPMGRMAEGRRSGFS